MIRQQLIDHLMRGIMHYDVEFRREEVHLRSRLSREALKAFMAKRA